MTARIGRNDPCSCGSGKKFKRCCWEASQFAEAKRHDLEHAAWKERMGRLSPEERERRRREVMAVIGMGAALGARLLPPDPAPRYDEVFHEGARALDEVGT